MTELKLPEELEEQAILHALGILDPENRQAFMVRLQGESDLLRQAVRAYRETTGALADAVAPVMPPSPLRERLLSRIDEQSDIQLDVTDSARVLSETPALLGESRERLSQEGGSFFSRLRSCWTASSNFLRTLVIRSMTSERVRYWKAKVALERDVVIGSSDRESSFGRKSNLDKLP